MPDLAVENVTFINQYTNPLLIDIINVFQKKGTKVRLLTGEINKSSAEIDDRIAIRMLNKYNRKSTFTRLFSWLLFTVRVFFILGFGSKKNKLFIVTNPPLVPFIGLIFHKLFKQKYYLLIYDIYPDALANFGFVRTGSPVYKIWARLNRPLLQSACQVFTISHLMAEQLKKYEPDCDPEVIFNWADTSFIKPIDKAQNEFAKIHRQINKLTVMYSGNLGITHDIESLVKAAVLLREEDHIEFLIIGDGAKKALLKDIITKEALQNVKLLPFQEADMYRYAIATADIGVVTLDNGAESVSIPSKTYYIMASGAAFLAIAPLQSELSRLVNKYDFGAIIPPGNDRAIADYILSLSKDQGKLLQFKRRSRAASDDFTNKNAYLYFEKIFGFRHRS